MSLRKCCGRLLSCLGSLCAVLGAGLISLGNALCVESSSDNVVTDTGQILNSSASDENNRVLLQIVTDTGNVRCYFVTVGKLNSGNFSHSGVGLLGSSRSYSGANASLLGGGKVYRRFLLGVITLLKSGGCGFLFDNVSSLAYKLIKSRHQYISFHRFSYAVRICDNIQLPQTQHAL